jgi:hypothetical protein
MDFAPGPRKIQSRPWPGMSPNPDVKIIYADYYGAAMEFVKNPHRYGNFGKII